MNFGEISGLDMLKKIISGAFPPPSMAATIPMKLVKVEKGFAQFQAEAGNNHLNPMGTVHGGFAATVLDSVTGCAVHTSLGPGDRYATVDLNVKMLRPIPTATRLTARARVIHCSKRLGVSEGGLMDDDGTVYAHATATCIIRRKQTQ